MPYCNVWSPFSYLRAGCVPLESSGQWDLLSRLLYKAIMQFDFLVDNNKKIWKMKIPLKTKKFAWYLRRGVILTKDNLARRNWHGSKRCVFCYQDETIKHLFFQCRFARSIWSIIKIASSLYPMTSVANVFGNWLHGIDLRFRMLIRVGTIAVIWSLWLCRNDKVFEDKNCSLLQVIYKCTDTLRLWSPLQRLENRDLFTEVCTQLEATARDIFPHMGGCIISGLDLLHLLRRYTIAHNDMYFAFCFELGYWSVVCFLLCRGQVYCLTK
jgi:hypothetical protein